MVIAIVVHTVHLRALRRLETLRVRDRILTAELSAAMDAVKKSEARVIKLIAELEQRVIERTSELIVSQERNRTLHNELNHVARVSTMGELAASLADLVRMAEKLRIPSPGSNPD